MNISSIPFVGNLYVSLILTSLIIGFVVIILIEKKNKATINEDKGVLSLNKERKNSYHVNPDPSDTSDIKSFENSKKEKPIIVNGTNESTTNDYSEDETRIISKLTENITEQEDNTEGTDENGEDNACSSNGKNSGKAGIKMRQRPKNHKCSGSEEICSKKKAVSAATILMDVEDELLQNSLEDLAAQFKTGGLTCVVRPSNRESHWLINNDATHLHIFLITTSVSKPHELLQVDVKNGMPTFLYSVVCLAGSNTLDVRLTGENVSTALSEVGGTEWLPVTDIILGENQQSSALTTQQYIGKVLKKAAKLSKKCCGTSCSSKKKAVDIEDLVTSFLPEVMPVKT